MHEVCICRRYAKVHMSKMCIQCVTQFWQPLDVIITQYIILMFNVHVISKVNSSNELRLNQV